MACLWPFRRRWLIAWAGAISIVSAFVERPTICVTRLFDLLFVIFGRLTLDAVYFRRMILSLELLAYARTLAIVGAWLAVDAVVL